MSSDADIVVLSLLAEQSRHGYDLDRVIEQRGYRQWTSLAFSSVYYLLKRLSERGLLEPDEGSQGRRTVFRLTEVGRRELKQAAAEGKDVMAVMKEYEREYEQTLVNPYMAAERGYVDAVIPPSETRGQIIEGLRLLDRKVVSVPAKKHGNIPL